jgi:hypothetical protein
MLHGCSALRNRAGSRPQAGGELRGGGARNAVKDNTWLKSERVTYSACPRSFTAKKESEQAERGEEVGSQARQLIP